VTAAEVYVGGLLDAGLSDWFCGRLKQQGLSQ
jgi:hypothetical protein